MRAFRELIKAMAVSTDEDVTGVLSRWNAEDRKPVGKRRRNVLHAVDCQIDFLSKKGLFNFFDKESFPADLRKWHIENFVSGSLDSPKAHRQRWGNVMQPRLNPLRLPHGKTAAPGSDHKG